MRKIVFALMVAASAAYAVEGLYSFGIGPGNNASNSNYAVTYGPFAGYAGQYDSRTALIGSLAGQNARYVQRSVGVGYGALYMASNCYDCVAIGDRAGAGWRNRTGWVDVGGAFFYTNGIADIKAPNGARIGPLKIESSENFLDHSIQGNWSVYSDGQGHYGNIHADGEVYGTSGDFNEVKTSYLSLSSWAFGDPTDIYIDEQGRLAVARNGTILGYLTITPPEE